MDYKKYPILKIFINTDNIPSNVLSSIMTNIYNHNYSVNYEPTPNAGFDLHFTDNVDFTQYNVGILVNHNIKCAMYNVNSDTSCAFYLYPRSSIFKTPLILANSVGIIDAGYRGWICSALKCMNLNCDITNPYTVNSETRLTQICHSSLSPFYIEIVEREEDLGKTTRGDGGFGSTGGCV